MLSQPRLGDTDTGSRGRSCGKGPGVCAPGADAGRGRSPAARGPHYLCRERSSSRRGVQATVPTGPWSPQWAALPQACSAPDSESRGCQANGGPPRAHPAPPEPLCYSSAHSLPPWEPLGGSTRRAHRGSCPARSAPRVDILLCPPRSSGSAPSRAPGVRGAP